MNGKIQQLTFEKGITNIPSDAVCSDNELEECMGLYHDGAEHRPIQNPVLFMENLAGEVIFVHKLAGETHYIYKTPLVYEHMRYHFTLSWRLKDDATAHEIATLNIGSQDTYKDIQVTAIGKTLIVNVPGEDIKYFLWKAELQNYKSLGTVPDANIEFRMTTPAKGLNNSIILAGVVHGQSQMDVSWFELYNPDRGNLKVRESHKDDYDNAAIGAYSKALREVEKNKGFALPFFVRYATEMYDGSYVNFSNPILMFPSVSSNILGGVPDEPTFLQIRVRYSLLEFKAEFDYGDWSDIVRGVSVFVTEGVPLYNTGSGQTPHYIDKNTICQNFITHIERTTGDAVSYHESTANGLWPQNNETSNPYYYVAPLNERSKEDISDDIKSKSIFYKISELGTKVDLTDGWKKIYIKDSVIENLTTQERLPNDYYSHCPMSANYITTYNNRLLLAGVRRGFFEGFTSFMPYNQNDSYSAREKILEIVVFIKTDEGTRIVSKRFTTSDIIGKYFFYPDPRAYRAKIYYVTPLSLEVYDLVKDIELKEHPFLNGAYYFEGLPDGTETMQGTTAYSTEGEVKTPEYLYNQVFNSEVNNPFVYRAEGNFTVGNGKVMALASLTQALSQGQFGQYPLIVFTDEGIYAASISNTGIVTAVHPMSREVLNNVDSVTQTDGAIFFSSEKGLMVVVGNEVKCVSEQLNGKSSAPLQTYLKTAYIAYDYRDSLLWIFNGSETCWIYSIKSGTFSHYKFQNASGSFVHTIGSVVNNYPDYLLQSDSDDAIYSLLERVNINESLDDDIYNCQIVTRPMKLENGLALKSIRQIRNIKQLVSDTYRMRRIDDYLLVPKLQLRIFASNDLKNWTELSSLRSTPWKYFKFQYDFAKLNAADRFAGTVLVTQERRTNKLR